MSNQETDHEPPERYLIPVEGLRLPHPWTVGRVAFHPGADRQSLIANAPPFEAKDNYIRSRVEQILESASDSSIAEVPGGQGIDTAIDETRASLDALRLFQLARHRTNTTAFGLPGDLYRARIDYVAIWTNSGPGGRFHGDAAGWEFTRESYEDWSNSTGFQFLSRALADPSASEGARRATVGAQLLSRAALEHRPDLKMLGVAAALEAWLLRREPGAQTMRLARHVSWFGCGRPEGSLCARDRPICPYLHLSPDDKRDRHRLVRLRELGNSYVEWQCSEWRQVMDWYDARSSAAHGDPTAVDAKRAEDAEYWVTHYLMEPILDWLRDHSDDPVGDLQDSLASIEDPDHWEAMTAALDSDAPPKIPPMASRHQ